MFETISLKFTERSAPLIVPAQGVTVFVGPNNAGKSLALREIEEAVYNSLFKATTTTGKGHTVEALPLDRTIQILRRHGLLESKK